MGAVSNPVQEKDKREGVRKEGGVPEEGRGNVEEKEKTIIRIVVPYKFKTAFINEIKNDIKAKQTELHCSI